MKIYFYGDSFTEPYFSAYRVREYLNCDKEESRTIERKQHYTTLVSNEFPNHTPVINAMGGWSNQDILVRILKDLPFYTKEDIVVAIGTEGSRMLMPSNLKHTIQQHGRSDGRSYRAKGYPLVGVPSTILAQELEKDIECEQWRAGVDMYHSVTMPYEADYRRYWEQALSSLFTHIKTLTYKSFYSNNSIWPKFETWNDIMGNEDGHWSIDGWKGASKYILNEMA